MRARCHTYLTTDERKGWPLLLVSEKNLHASFAEEKRRVYTRYAATASPVLVTPFCIGGEKDGACKIEFKWPLQVVTREEQQLCR